MEKSTGPILISGPREADIALRSMEFTEELSMPFVYSLDVLSDKNDLTPKEFLGQSMTVTVIDLPKEGKRFFNGWVSEFYLLGGIGEHTLYRIVLRPWLWFLQNTSDCRIYNNLSIPDLIKDEVLKLKHDISDVDLKVFGYKPREYITQYRESDFNFVSRLLEAEGIHYFFRHHAGKHEMVLCDNVYQHDPTPEYGELPYMHVGDRKRLQHEHIHSWQTRHRVVSGKVYLSDFNFREATAAIDADHTDPEKHGRSEAEVFDYPGGYEDEATGKAIALRRLEEIKAGHAAVMGESNARGLAVGATFKLKEHPIKSQNAEYLVTSMRGTLVGPDLTSQATANPVELFRCQFTALPSDRPYRPARRTPCPIIHGVQTARVVGPIGKEIATDEYGRVLLAFYWNRFSTWEGKESCWVRVSQLWAGSEWGGMHIPRIGHEVLVEFLEGDPDKPIITGRVYNGENKPPYKLDDNATQSGIKSRSTPDGTAQNFNEIRFEDKKGKEDLFIHAENTQTTTVKGSQSISVGGKRTISVTKEDKETFDNTRELTVKLTNTETVKKLHTANYELGRTVNVTKENDALTVSTGNVTQDVTVGTYKVTAKGAYSVTHNGTHVLSLDGGKAVLTNGTSAVAMDKAKAIVTSGDGAATLGVEGSKAVLLTKEGSATITLEGDAVTISGPSSITIQCGATSKVVLSGDSVTVTGTMVNLNC